MLKEQEPKAWEQMGKPVLPASFGGGRAVILKVKSGLNGQNEGIKRQAAWTEKILYLSVILAWALALVVFFNIVRTYNELKI